jgi:hemerythrin-like domain-containing protein
MNIFQIKTTGKAIVMQPINLLMKEHRLMERMITLLETELQKSKKSLKINTEFITVAIDFFRTYADRTHHGKEEDILFKALSKTKLSEELQRTMNQLLGRITKPYERS